MRREGLAACAALLVAVGPSAAHRPGLATAHFSPGGAPVALAATRGRIWVVVETGGLRVGLVGLDPASGRREAAFTIGRTGPDFGAVTSSGGAVWAAAGKHVVRIDPTRPGVVERAPLPGEAAAIAAGYGSVWVATIGSPRDFVVRLDASSLAVEARIPLTFPPVALRAALGSVWVASPSGLWRIAPTGNRLVPARDPFPLLVGLAVSGGRLWAIEQDMTAAAVDRNGHVEARVRLPFSPGAGAVTAARLWVIDNCGCHSGKLALVDLSSRRVAATEPIGGTPVAVAAIGSTAWVATFADETVWRIRV